MTNTRQAITWAELGPPARAFRIAHGAWGVLNLAALGWLWRAALLRRRDSAVYASAAELSTQGVALIVGRGNCPLGPFQARLGDPVPMFEWMLPPRAAKAAIPGLTAIAGVSIAAVLARPPREARTRLGA
jgi:hypothetical protein